VRHTIIPAAAVFILAAAAHSAAAAPPRVRVIVHPNVKGSQIPRATLTSIFLRQAKKWGDGTTVVPVDQSIRSDVRSQFSNALLGQTVMDVQIYWQRRMPTGLLPPPVKTSDDDVITFVSSTPGAIGYVSLDANVPESVKSIEVTN
jgi:ABC-type phosphate transport system substrate-binding protein